MSIAAEQLLKEFESLPDSDKHEVASEGEQGLKWM